MFGFRKRQAAPPDAENRLAHLEAELTKVQSTVRQLEGEQILLHDQVRKWMRRAVAAERAIGRGEPQAAPAPPAAPRRMWGPRARRMMRGDPLAEQPVATNGVTHDEEE